MELVGGKNLVIYEDNHLIIVRKNASDIVQGDKTGDRPLNEKVKSFLKEKYNKPGNVFLGTIHRIDRPVSGLVIFAKTSKALARMNKMFQDKTIQKTYWAVVEKKPPHEEGQCVDYLIKNTKKNKSFVVSKDTSGAKKAELTYKLIASSDRYYLLEVFPKTGRHHQIRVQLSNMGCVIKGDLKYGAKRSNKDASIHLHAQKVRFTHPVSNEDLVITAPLPEEPLWSYFEKVTQTK